MKHKTQTMTGNLRLSLMLFFGLVLFLCAGTVIANADTTGVTIENGIATFDNARSDEPMTFTTDTTIVLKGDSEITGVEPLMPGSPFGDMFYSIDADNVTLTIKGTGSLKLSGAISAGKFNMQSGKVTVDCADSGYGLIYDKSAAVTGGQLTINTKSNITMSEFKGYPIGAIMAMPSGAEGERTLTISNGAKVSVSGGMFAVFGYKVVIDNATVDAKAGTGEYPSTGILAVDLQIKNGSKVKATGIMMGVEASRSAVFDGSYVEMLATGEFNIPTNISADWPDPMGFAALKTSGNPSVDISIKNSNVTTLASYKTGDVKMGSSDSSPTATVIMDSKGSVAPKVIIEPVVPVTAAESAIMNALGVDAATAKAINAYAAKNGISADTLKITNKLLTTGNTDSDVKGSKFGLLQAYTKKIKKKAVTIKWKKVPGADGYMIYSNKCGKKNKCKLVKTLPAGKTSFTSKKLKKGTYYKYIVVAYKNFNGTKVTISASPTIHAATLGGKYGVAKKVKITKVGKKKKAKITLKKGKKAKIKAKEIKAKKKIKRHRKLCYESSNTKVATVTKKGVIKAVGKGKCKIYVYAQNGVNKAVTVTVK